MSARNARSLVARARKRRRFLWAGLDLFAPRPTVKPLEIAPLDRWLGALGFKDDVARGVSILGVAAGLKHSLIAYSTATGVQRVLALGGNDRGQLGIGYSSTEPTRGHVEGFEGERIVGLSAGNMSSYLLVEQHDGSNSLYAFGLNSRGQLSIKRHIEPKPAERSLDMACRAAEITLPTNTDGSRRSVVSLAVGFEHVLALCDNGSLLATGANPDGQLGLGDQSDRDTFTEITLAPLQRHEKVVRVVAGADSSGFITKSGLFYAFGNSEYGQALHGRVYDAMTKPLVVDWSKPIQQVAFGGSFAVMLDKSGTVSTAGYGALGLGQNRLESLLPNHLPKLDGTTAIRAAFNYAAAIKDGQVYLWGLAQSKTGRLGFGADVERLDEPTHLPLPPGLERARVVDAQLGGEQLWLVVEQDHDDVH